MKRDAAWDATQAGIKLAEDGQERRCNGWKEMATAYLLSYAKMAQQFTAEDVIEASAGIVPEAKEKRAWGSIFQAASRRGIIVRVGYQPIRGVQAHQRPVSVWQSKISL